MSLAIAGVSNAAGQVVYTDIDPDETIDDSTYEVDFNGDSIVDFTITNNGAGGFAVRMYNDQSNSVMGQNFGGNYNYPDVLSSSAIIGSTANFTANPYYQTLNWNGCTYTNSQWCGGITDRFVGVAFNVGSDVHYGWIQLDVPEDAATFTIKGFAFDATPGEAIFAGDQGLGTDDNNFVDFVQFMDADGNLNVSAATVIEDVTIHNIAGQSVIQTTVNNNRGVIALNNLSNGIYIATVTIEGQRKSFKLVK